MTTEGQRITEAVALVGEAIALLDKMLADVDSTTVQEAALALAQLRGPLARARQCDAALEVWIATCFREEGWRDPVELPAGMVEVRRSTTRRSWRHDDARRDWLNALMTKRGGEVLDPADVRDEFCRVATVSGYKVGGMKALGLNVNDYAETEPGVPHVYITGGAS